MTLLLVLTGIVIGIAIAAIIIKPKKKEKPRPPDIIGKPQIRSTYTPPSYIPPSQKIFNSKRDDVIITGGSDYDSGSSSSDSSDCGSSDCGCDCGGGGD